MEREELRNLILESLQNQGFSLRDGVIAHSADQQKEDLRRLHSCAVQHRQEAAHSSVRRREARLLELVANGHEVDPSAVRPRLVAVNRGSVEELFFRYATLHWSIPTSAGYGRRLRFLVIDESNNKVMGLFALGDPVIAMKARDNWIGWDPKRRERNLQNVMDAFVLGAVPPYNFLLGAKLVAMLTASKEVRDVFKAKYSASTSRIQGRALSGELAMITTTSALGRSSIYNRVTHRGRRLFHSVGYTGGSGEFHFSNGVYAAIREYADEHCQATYRKPQWGKGFRSRREVLQKVLPAIGLPRELIYHQVKREIFVVPLGRNCREFLLDGQVAFEPYEVSVDEHFKWFRERWLLPRALRDKRYRDWTRDQWKLW